jgi:hypothetical protein
LSSPKLLDQGEQSLADEVVELPDRSPALSHGERVVVEMLLTLAARRELERRDPDAVQAAIARSRERFRTAGAFESADLVRADRDARS